MAGADRAFLLLPARGTRQPPGTGLRVRGRLAATPVRRRTGAAMDPSSDEAALLRSVHESRGDATPRMVYADYLDDNGRPQEAAMHRYIAEPTDRHRDEFVRQHGGRASDAAHQLSHHIYKRAFTHGDKFLAADEPPYEPAYRAARNAGYAADEGSVGPGRMDRHHRAAEGHAEEARNFETLPGRHNLPADSTNAAVELHTLHAAAEKLHRHARSTLRGVA